MHLTMAPAVMLALQELPPRMLKLQMQMAAQQTRKARMVKRRNGMHLTMAPAVMLTFQSLEQGVPIMLLQPFCRRRQRLRLLALLARVQRTPQRR